MYKRQSLFHGHSVKTDPMPDFNLERYLGEWHEIARLENWFERGLRKVLAPVSYTHLDVYKRQVEGLAAGLSGGFLPDAPDSFLVDFFLPVGFGWFPGTGKVAVPDGAFLRKGDVVLRGVWKGGRRCVEETGYHHASAIRAMP